MAREGIDDMRRALQNTQGKIAELSARLEALKREEQSLTTMIPTREKAAQSVAARSTVQSTTRPAGPFASGGYTRASVAPEDTIRVRMYTTDLAKEINPNQILELVGKRLSEIRKRYTKVVRNDVAYDLTIAIYVCGSADRVDWDEIEDEAKKVLATMGGKGTPKNTVVAIIRRHETLNRAPTDLLREETVRSGASFVQLVFSFTKGGFILDEASEAIASKVTDSSGKPKGFTAYNGIGVDRIAKLCAAMM
jgi:hypothetical protein